MSIPRGEISTNSGCLLDTIDFTNCVPVRRDPCTYMVHFQSWDEFKVAHVHRYDGVTKEWRHHATISLKDGRMTVDRQLVHPFDDEDLYRIVEEAAE